MSDSPSVFDSSFDTAAKPRRISILLWSMKAYLILTSITAVVLIILGIVGMGFLNFRFDITSYDVFYVTFFIGINLASIAVAVLVYMEWQKAFLMVLLLGIFKILTYFYEIYTIYSIMTDPDIVQASFGKVIPVVFHAAFLTMYYRRMYQWEHESVSAYELTKKNF